MTDNTSPDAFTQPPIPEPAPPRPSRWQRFLAFPITRIVLYLLLFVAITAVLSSTLNEALHLLHHRSGYNKRLGAFPGEGLAVVSALLAFWIMVRFVDRRLWATAGFTLGRMPAQLGGGFALGAAMLTVGVGTLTLLGMYHATTVVPSVLVLVPLGLYLCIAVFEETYFRGYIFQALEGRWGSGIALGVTSLVFGLAHLGNPTPGATRLQHLVGPLQLCLEAGLPLGAAYLLTRRWWLPIGIHWAWDYFEGPIYGCPDSGNHDPHTLLHSAFTGPALLTGGPFGPEAGLVLLAVGTLTGVLLLQMAVRRGQWQPMPR